MTDHASLRAPARSDRLAEAVAAANIPTLLLVLTHLTGDTGWLQAPYAPGPTRGLDPNDDGDLPPETLQTVREAAARAIAAWLEGQAPALAEPDDEMLVWMLGRGVGEDVPLGYAEMIREELALVGPRPWEAAPPPVPGRFRALVIGAGASGICAAPSPAAAGIDSRILERTDRIGGVWAENTYPGAGVDTPSHLYCFSFAPNDWSRYFAGQDEIRGYLERVARETGIAGNIDFGVEVESARFDEAAGEWELETRRADGGREMLRANLVISAVGAFNKPKYPKIPGMERFRGPMPHSARWPEALDLDGKDVAVIGNGASAMQIVPALADRASQMTVYQRSKQWAAPFPQFRKPIPEAERWLFDTVPLYARWYRTRLAWIFNDRIYDSLHRDPDWPHPERSLNAVNDAHRRFFTKYIEAELGDRQEMLPEVLPDYPPFGKRMLLDNGWFRTVARDDVTLLNQAIREIDETGIRTADGTHRAHDAIVLATGFDVQRFLAPMQVTGRGGVELDRVWNGDDPRAYLGSAIPGFPNFFCLYGPNTQFGHGGSLIFMLELQMHYLMSLVTQMLEAGAATAEVRQDVHDAYNERVDALHANMVWTHPGMDVYYRNSKGRVVVNNPFKIVDYWQYVRRADLSDYILAPAPEAERRVS